MHRITHRAIATAWGLMLGCTLMPASSIAQAQPAQVEVEHLLTFVAASNCDFYRNGTWYSAAQAQAHLREKFAIVFPGSLAPTAEEFIEKVATKSAFTSIPYQIRCAREKPMAVKDWLLGELRHYRK
jgi:Family of unknown function (DUF5329)